MSRLSLRYAMIAICLSTTLCLSTSRALGQESQTKGADALLPADSRSCVFADNKTLFSYFHPDAVARDVEWHVEWSLMAGARTITRGSGEVMLLGGSDSPQQIVQIPTPPLRDNVVLPVQLQMTWTAGDKKYHHTRPLFIFSRNPFAVRQAFLEEAQIKLFDVDGETAELLDAHEIPHSRLLNLSAMDRLTEGIVLIGEGVSFRQQRRLAETLFQAAQRGVSVLCLAPSEGALCPLTSEENGQFLQPSRLLLERENVVLRYDKRFDKIPTLSYLALEPRRNEVVISDANDQGGWSWLELEFPPEATKKKTPGRLIVCGLGMVSHWEASPVPRYLFVHLLEELTPTKSNLEEQKDAFTQ